MFVCLFRETAAALRPRLFAPVEDHSKTLPVDHRLRRAVGLRKQVLIRSSGEETKQSRRNIAVRDGTNKQKRASTNKLAHTLAWSATCNHARRRSHSARGGVECYACAADACGNSGAAAIGPVGARHAAQEGMYVYCSMIQDAAAVQQSRRTCLSSLSSVIGVESSETNLTQTGPGAKHLSSAEPCTGGESMWPVESPRSRSRLRRTRTAIRAHFVRRSITTSAKPLWGNEGCVKGMAVVVRCSCRGQ